MLLINVLGVGGDLLDGSLVWFPSCWKIFSSLCAYKNAVLAALNLFNAVVTQSFYLRVN